MASAPLVAVGSEAAVVELQPEQQEPPKPEAALEQLFPEADFPAQLRPRQPCWTRYNTAYQQHAGLRRLSAIHLSGAVGKYIRQQKEQGPRMPQEINKASSVNYPILVQNLLQGSGNKAVCKLPAGLYVVATPIGNLGDITLRAITTLANADAIACEDTRNSGLMLQAFSIKKPLLSYHDHNADERRPEIIRRISQGEAIALISDAGTPAIADPGFKLARDCHDAGLSVFSIPGANAAIAALSAAGLPTDAFHFAGFLPSKTTARKKELSRLVHIEATLVFYESPQRLPESLSDMADVLGKERPAAIAREITKLYEEIRRGSLLELAESYKDASVKGEIVVLVSGRIPDDESSEQDLDSLLKSRLEKLSVRDAAAEVAEMTGVPKKEVYARAVALSEKNKNSQ